LGRANTLACRDEIATRLSDSELVVIVAGMGGGTGTGGAPVFAQIGRDLGAAVVGVVTRPFTYEGKRRRQRAEHGIDTLKACVDALVVLNNDDHPVRTAVGQTSDIYEWRGVTMATLRAVREILEIHAAHSTDRQQFSVLVSQMTASK
jgi:cell division GTPase FtsZ